MKVAVTGASGLIGSALVPHLRAEGHEVVALVRREPRAADEVRWDPAAGTVDLGGLAGVEGVVHLAGVGVGDKRWTDDYKQQILRSRVDGTKTIATAMARLDPLPQVLVSASAVGFYGDRGDDVLTEASGPGEGFLPEVVLAWESAAAPARAAGIRVAHPRTGLVMDPRGGAFGKLMPLVRLGLGGPLGSGRQWWPWITMPDEVRAITYLLTGDLAGPVNLAGPAPARQKDVAAALAQQVHRPSIVPAPGFALRAILGEFAADITGSQRVVPQALTTSGFTFTHPSLVEAATYLMAR
jgi:uncharacterized protein (TIGR01777 family)